MENKETYHDYVIKDGKFIGKFDEMYSRFPDPWMQSTQPNKYSRSAGIQHLKSLFGVKAVLECGCGLGYYTEWINMETNMFVKGIDISEVAIKKANKLHWPPQFEVANIVTDLHKYKGYQCIILSEIIWYILPDLQKIFKDLETHFKGKHLIVNQVFYKGTQKYGNEYFTNLKEFIDYVPFRLIAQCEATTISDTTIETSTMFRI